MNHLQRYLTDEFTEDYQEGRLSRRDALKLIASVTGSLIVANSVLAACVPPPEQTQAVSPTEVLSTTEPATVQPTGTESQTSVPASYGTVMPETKTVKSRYFFIEFPLNKMGGLYTLRDWRLRNSE